jgi:hypothetical protein
MANDTPPNKRHHLPFSMTSRLNSSSNLQPQQQQGQPCGGKLNRIFVLTCVASVVLQLFGSLASWQNQSNNRPQTTGVSPSFMDPLQQRHPSRALHLQPAAPRTADNSKGPLSLSSSSTSDASYAAAATDATGDDSKDLPKHKGRLKMLWGILTADFYNDQAYRKRHRKLFELWDDPRVCSLPDFKHKSVEEREVCELIYTFVVGGNQDASPELVDDSRPMTATRPVPAKSPDLNDPDVTLLNIKENMNEGKSQTWLKHGAEIAEQYGLDYVVKCDADAMLHLHEFFTFAYKHLPPAPYNTHVYAGALRDKAYWPRHKTEEERIRYESYFGNNFEGVHLYVAGQIYIMSTDLAKFVGQEALENKCSYCEGHEDHDISAMAFHSPEPIKLLVIGRKQRFWEHPVKGEPRWKRIWAREQARMSGVPFEGKLFFKNSSLAAVLSK